MSDQELLKLAAKAIGLKITEFAQGGFGDSASVIAATLEGQESLSWNPLRDDGDALRLAVKLDLLNENPTFLWHLAGEAMPGADPIAATRRAIVRAAAEMGRAMG